MAEAIGVGASVVTLLKLCIDAFELIKLGRAQDLDYKKLVLRLNIERARLYTWGQSMGLVSGRDGIAHTINALQESPFYSLICDTLRMIAQLFSDGKRLQEIYGCVVYKEQVDRKRKSLPTADNGDALENLAGSFGFFHVAYGKAAGRRAKLASRVKWAIQDQKKFGILITEVCGLIDGLQDITKSLSSVARQEGLMRYSIQQITDGDTLSLVTEVCLDSHPDISDAASVKVDIMTMATDKRQAIESWASSIDANSSPNEYDDLESLTITELQDLLRKKRSQESTRGTVIGVHNLDRVVMQYLTKRGYYGTERLLRKELEGYGPVKSTQPIDLSERVHEESPRRETFRSSPI